MIDRDYNRDPQQCRVKIKELRQAYQKTKEANGCSGSEPQTCRFYDELHAVLGYAPTTTIPLSMDTCKGGVSRNRDEDFGDEEDDNEEEKDSTQQASGETILPDSQELFITLEPIPSQGGLPDHEAGEGTSEYFNNHFQLKRVNIAPTSCCHFRDLDKSFKVFVIQSTPVQFKSAVKVPSPL
ncbi:hypothetical protein UY3_00434 [Chelonia mydas]|uniref:Myb/SANT-like DNA-binding domain-containing protein n=1 Tax=Chelonia mydas TaxID=8469 RepID=M7BYH7_CHEMY|nr:hypothetical protein UY3_00434 [Chelonia mydas]